MNRFVSLLLVVLSLVAVSLAQPAQAQQGHWVKGLPYYFNDNTQSGGNVTASPVGHISITSTPVPGFPGYNTGGSYSGSVGIYYVWWGGNPTSDMTLTISQSFEVSGAGDSFSVGYSKAGNVYRSFSYGTTGWDTTGSSAPSFNFPAGAPPDSVNLSEPLGGNISGYYDQSSSTASTIVTADVTFGDPVVTQ